MNNFLYLLMLTLPLFFGFDSSYSLNNPYYQTDKANIQIATGLKFINDYVKNSTSSKHFVEIDKWVESNKLVSKAFKTNFEKLMKEAYKNDPEMGLGFDPIFDAQDFPEKGFELESYNKETGFMTVKGIEWSDFKVTMKLVKIKDKWLVDGCGVINIPENKRSPR
jgi:hypothetical protein